MAAARTAVGAAAALVETDSKYLGVVDTVVVAIAVDTECLVVAAVASLHHLDSLAVVAQGSPFVYGDSAHSSLWGK